MSMKQTIEQELEKITGAATTVETDSMGVVVYAEGKELYHAADQTWYSDFGRDMTRKITHYFEDEASMIEEFVDKPYTGITKEEAVYYSSLKRLDADTIDRCIYEASRLGEREVFFADCILGGEEEADLATRGFDVKKKPGTVTISWA